VRRGGSRSDGAAESLIPKLDYLSAIPANKPAIADNGVQTLAAIVSLTFASPCQITP